MCLGGSRAKEFRAAGTVSEIERKGPQGRADRGGPPTRDHSASHSFFQAALPGIGPTLAGRTQTATTHSSLRASIGQTGGDGSLPAPRYGEPPQNQNRHDHPPPPRGALTCFCGTIPASCRKQTAPQSALTIFRRTELRVVDLAAKQDRALAKGRFGLPPLTDD